MAAKRRNRAIARVTAKAQKKNPAYNWTGHAFDTGKGYNISREEKELFEQLTQGANHRRNEMKSMLNLLPRKLEGVEVGGTVGELRSMGRNVEFVLAEKNKKWSDFKSKESFDRYLNRLRVINEPNYVQDRIRLYKQNFTKSLLETYGPQARDIAMKIRMMKPEEYMKMVEADESLEIGYYADSDDFVPGLLNKLRRSLGMKEKDEEWSEEYR